mmetsp:Transcript_38789/g.91213  ORF Transcript_38789/g.91213 Transcript_38789/m.91213 type:complete len:521 (+) Transcript_38789:143-1705(+)
MAKTHADVDLSGFGFEKLQHIGKGQYAQAQLVKDVSSGHTYVAKCISLAALNDHDQDLAHQEVFLLQTFNHPYIVGYRDSFLIEGANTLVIVMEYCNAGDLRKAIKEKVKCQEHFAEEQVMTWFVQLCLALQYIHSEKVLHRDLKTSNIFLCNADSSLVKLGDFGISRILECTSDAAVTMVGTPYYMSPEVCRNEPYGVKSDIWALGCVLYELCMLRFAFESSSLHGLVYKIVSGHYEPIPSFYSPAINQMLSRLLEKQADGRPLASEILEDACCRPYLEQLQQSGIPIATNAEGSKAVAAPEVPQSRGPPPRSLTLSLEPLANTTATPQASLQNPHVRTLVLGTRVRRRLAIQRLNWVSAFGALDSNGDGYVPQEAMSGALIDFNLGLSRDEAASFAQSLAAVGAGGPRVSLQVFEQILAEGMQSAEVSSIEAVVMRIAKGIYDRLRAALMSRDEARSGLLDQATFLAAIQSSMPSTLESYESEALLLMTDKDASGSIDYLRFLDAFEPLSPKGGGFFA